jgi:hypothetical protein
MLHAPRGALCVRASQAVATAHVVAQPGAARAFVQRSLVAAVHVVARAPDRHAPRSLWPVRRARRTVRGADDALSVTASIKPGLGVALAPSGRWRFRREGAPCGRTLSRQTAPAKCARPNEPRLTRHRQARQKGCSIRESACKKNAPGKNPGALPQKTRAACAWCAARTRALKARHG